MARLEVRVRVRARARARVRLKCGGPGRTLIAVGSSEKREASTPTTAMCSVHGRAFAPSAAPWMHSYCLCLLQPVDFCCGRHVHCGSPLGSATDIAITASIMC